jgi:hypothetical protein
MSTTCFGYCAVPFLPATVQYPPDRSLCITLPTTCFGHCAVPSRPATVQYPPDHMFRPLCCNVITVCSPARHPVDVPLSVITVNINPCGCSTSWPNSQPTFACRRCVTTGPCVAAQGVGDSATWQPEGCQDFCITVKWHKFPFHLRGCNSARYTISLACSLNVRLVCVCVCV